MSKYEWNYDITACPVRVLIKLKCGGETIASKMYRNGEFVFDNFNTSNIDIDEVVAWATYNAPSEPEKWIKHDNNSFPNCLPMDVVKVRREYSKDVEDGVATSFNWGYPTVTGSRIVEYCIVRKT